MNSLKARGSQLAESFFQLEVLNNTPLAFSSLPRFSDKLKESGMFPLLPAGITIFQVNIGKMCNIACHHCHVDSAPDRKEMMSKETMQYCIDTLKNSPIPTVDITGGAPEMHPHFKWFVEEISALNKKIIIRSNLTILVSNKKFRNYPAFFSNHQVIVIASLPCYTKENTDQQRGDGVFEKSIEALKLLNEAGYGKEESGLELHLVYNPVGTSLPPSQQKLEDDYKRELATHHGIVFNRLYTITNMPIGRFLDELLQTGKYQDYMEKLVHSFNPATASEVMCRNTLSVSWDGYLYDCDFNQMLDLKLQTPGNRHISDVDLALLNNREIILNQHCYGCTAGAGSSCQGQLDSSK